MKHGIILSVFSEWIYSETRVKDELKWWKIFSPESKTACGTGTIRISAIFVRQQTAVSFLKNATRPTYIIIACTGRRRKMPGSPVFWRICLSRKKDIWNCAAYHRLPEPGSGGRGRILGNQYLFWRVQIEGFGQKAEQYPVWENLRPLSPLF